VTDFSAVFKRARPRALASLRRFCGDLDRAEDAIQDAVEQALKHWSGDGVPDSPTAWLIQVGKRRLVDEARRARFVLPIESEPEARVAEPDLSGVDDDLLRLIFTCCHPALNESAQVALTLKLIAGLSTDDVAAAFLVPRRTMEQRLQRARGKLRRAGIPFRIPASEELEARLDAVMTTIYLIFNQGYSARVGHVIDASLCDEAIWLARLLLRLYPGHSELAGLLCLMLFHASRLPARLDGEGEIVPLDRQDRSLWQKARIEEAAALLQHVLGRQRPGPYQTQAAIAALHCEAKSAASTDWAQIALLYRVLEQQAPNPVVTINRAVALGEAGEFEAGSALLQSLDDRLPVNYLPLLLARSRLAVLASEIDTASDHLVSAIDLTVNAAERRFLEAELRSLRLAESCRVNDEAH